MKIKSLLLGSIAALGLAAAFAAPALASPPETTALGGMSLDHYLFSDNFGGASLDPYEDFVLNDPLGVGLDPFEGGTILTVGYVSFEFSVVDLLDSGGAISGTSYGCSTSIGEIIGLKGDPGAALACTLGFDPLPAGHGPS